jgi:signal transduction histidine kinase
MRRSITTRMVVASGTLALIVAVIFVVLVVAIREQRRSARGAIKSEQAITAGVSLEKQAIDLETGVRGFVASGSPVLLQPYTNSRKQYPQQAAQLEQMVSRDPLARQQVRAIQGAINDYVNLYSIPMVSLARENPEVARSVIINNTGRDRIDGIRRQFNSLFATERAIAAKRTQQASDRATMAIWSGVVGLLVAVVSIIVLALYLRRAVVRPVREVARGAERVSQGDLSARAPDQRHDELGDLGRAFNTMATSLEHSHEVVEARTSELERSNRELDQFAAVTSHDLKEPLQTITVFAGLLNRDYRDQLDESGRTFLDSILASTERMRTLIRDLLEFSRVGHGELQVEEMPAEELIERARDNLAGHIAERGATVTIEPLPTVEVDPNQLCQVFQNLLSNALKFSDEEAPQVHVSATLDEHCWRFAVQDNGVGIAPDQAERIFKPFARLGAAKEGSGIGLAICQRIVEHHGGRIWVEAAPGGGSTFYFTIPDVTGDTQPAPAPEHVSV